MHLQEGDQVPGEGAEFLQAVHLCDVLWKRSGGDGAANCGVQGQEPVQQLEGGGREGHQGCSLLNITVMFQFEECLSVLYNLSSSVCLSVLNNN